MNKSLSERLSENQNNVIKITKNYFKGHKSGYIAKPTGTGKTRLGCMSIKELTKKHHRILWMSFGDELIEQTKNAIQSYFPERSVGLVRRGHESFHSDIVVASAASLNPEKLQKLPNDYFDLLIIDECHHSPAPTWIRGIDYFKCKKLGLTPTPWRLDGKSLLDIFENKIYEMPYAEAVEKKLIADPVVKLILTNSVINTERKKGKDFTAKELDRVVYSKNRNKIIVRSYKEYARKEMDKRGLKYKTICFCVTIKHAEKLKEVFKTAGISCEVLHAESIGRKDIYDTFVYTNKIEVLFVVGIMNEGRDIPDVSCTLHARPTKSLGLFMNQLGRGSRCIDGIKDTQIVLSFVDIIKYKLSRNVLVSLNNIQSQIPNDKIEKIIKYYKGKDPVVLDRFFNDLPDYLDRIKRDYDWNKDNIKRLCLEYYEKKGKITVNDFMLKNGLPTRTIVTKIYGSFVELFKVLDLPYRPVQRAHSDKELIKEIILEYYSKHGKISILDLGSKNNLPSQKAIQKHWGGWIPFCKEYGLNYSLSGKRYKSGEEVVQSIYRYMVKSKRETISRRFIMKQRGLPKEEVINRFFGSWTGFLQHYEQRYGTKMANKITAETA